MSESHYLTAGRELAREHTGDGWTDLRARGLARFQESGFPTTREEDFRFTNLAPLADLALAPGRPSRNGVDPAEVARLALAPGLVFLDGHFRPDLSHVPGGVRAGGLADAPPDSGANVRVGRLADGTQALVALNDAFLADGAWVHVARGVRPGEAVHVLFLGTGKTAFPRNLYVVEEGAEVEIVEHWVSLEDGAHATDTVTEIELGADAALTHMRLQAENEHAVHVSNVNVELARDSRYVSHLTTLGGALTRNDINARLDGEGAACTLNGLFLTRGRQHVDNHTRIHHRQPNAESHELYKGILDGESSGVFTGYIHVHPGAQKTDAYQSSASLLLSDRAVMDSKPQLEIYADDVKCSHGSTIGQLDADALFYLRSRGIPRDRAHRMLIQAFAHDVIDRMDVEPARARVDALLEERLPADAEA